MPQPSETYESALPVLLGPDRHGTYLVRAGGDPIQADRLYIWNIAIAGALWGGFHVLEVSLRNAIHRELSTIAGQEDWWSVLPLQKFEREKVAAAVRSIQRTKASGAGIGHIVAELTFGFWTGLLANRYHQRLWMAGVAHAFPHLEETRRQLHMKVERLRMLRNRVAHHEPVFARNLADDHRMLLEVLFAIDHGASHVVEQNSRVPHLLECRDDVVAGYWPAQF